MRSLSKHILRARQTLNDPRWQRVLQRDTSADALFYYAVTTTGVYCRPSCGARAARPEHVQFFANTIAAETAGFRPCQRCKPDQPALSTVHAAKVEHACRLIENAETTLPLQQLAAAVDLSASYFHRLFKAITGLTPRAYASAHRTNTLKKALSTSNSVTGAIYAAGYGSSSRFYQSAGRILGMKPSVYRQGGTGTKIRFALGECSLGSILVACSDKGVCAITLGDDPTMLIRDLQDRFPKSELVGGDINFENLVARVVGFIEAPQLGLELPLDVRGTVFQQRVWRALQDIPYGSRISYAELARRIGQPKAVRAVAQACAANTHAVAIPCHRVVRTDGALSGYRWGVERKRTLLAREADESDDHATEHS